MIADLLREQLDAVGTRQLRAALSTGPWCWPHEDDEELFRRARRIVPGGPPALQPGTVCLLTVTDRPHAAASLWVLRFDDPAEPNGKERIPLHPEAQCAWEDAALALPRALPVLWKPVLEARDAPHSVCHLYTLPLESGLVPRPTIVRGRSLGLAFVLALASRVFGIPIPEDVAATGVVDPDGRVGEVGGLFQKATILAACAPRVRRLLVPGSQVEEAQGCGIEVLPINKAAEAVELVFGEALRDFLRRAGHTPEARAELVDSLFRLALRGREAAVHWTPVERGAATALACWPGLTARERWRLKFAQAVAARHENNRGDMPLPDEPEMGELPAPLRIAVLTHMVQHAADTGKPPRAAIEAVIRHTLAPLADAFSPQLKLWGAWARLLAVTGDPEDALAIQEEVAAAFLARLEYEEISYPLCEWYRLAGALENRPAFQRAEEMRALVLRSAGLGAHGTMYVELRRAGALVCLGNGADVTSTLVSVAEALRLPDHLRWCAYRWLMRCEGEWSRKSSEPIRSAVPPIRRSLDTESTTATAALALIELEHALERGDEKRAATALTRLEKADPGPVGQLIAAAHRAGVPATGYVARFYPY